MYELLQTEPGLATQFIYHLHTQLVTINNSNSLDGLHTLKFTVNCSTCKVFYVFSSRSW
jgi:hypothetical protein